jgi:hypothetical protein
MDPQKRPPLENLRIAVDRQREVRDREFRRIADAFAQDEEEREADLRRLDACDRLLVEAEEAFGVGSFERSVAILDRADALIAVTRRYVRETRSERVASSSLPHR